MVVELSPEERDILVRLVDTEIREIGPEIHHTRTYKEPLKEQRQRLMVLHDRLACAGTVPPGTCTTRPSEDLAATA